METLSLRVVAPPEAEIRTIPLPLEAGGSPCSVYLRCLPGAAAIHCAFVNGDGSIVLRTEVQATGGEKVRIGVALGTEREMRVWSPGRKVLTLPKEAPYEPPPTLRVAGSGTRLDLAFVIDGTARRFSFDGKQSVSEPWLGKQVWEEPVNLLAGFAAALVEGSQGSRFSVLAFGDEGMKGVEPEDLADGYLLRPPAGAGRFFPWSPERCREALSAVEPTPGGDFVDALAEALHACRSLPWGEGTRRIVLVCGDSPGHSVAHPLPPGADARVRRLDVDVEAEHLHERGVEIATLYFDPQGNAGLGQAVFRKELLAAARDQYRRLASLPEMAFELSRFQSEEAARVVKDVQGLLARRAAPGELIGVSEP